MESTELAKMDDAKVSDAVQLDLAVIRRDGGTQPRATMDPATITAYAEALADGATFPPVTVFHDGTDYWLADGFHRAEVFAQAGKTKIEADERPGPRRRLPAGLRFRAAPE